MYHPYVRLGEGWIPLASGTQIQTGFRNNFGIPPLHEEQPHYGLIELPYGDVRIILCQFIPEYQWLNNDKGAADSVGRLFIENMLDYAFAQAKVR